MLTPSYFLIHVANPTASADFYSRLLGIEPVEASSTFVLFVFAGGIKLGLWKRDTVVPTSTGAPGALEVGILLETVAEVDDLHERCVKAGRTIVQAPTDLDFGRSLTLADPDGHRLRFFALTL